MLKIIATTNMVTATLTSNQQTTEQAEKNGNLLTNSWIVFKKLHFILI